MSIHIGDVSVQYSGSEESVLHGISLDIEPGTVTLICGASGSGKSSVLRLINGLIPPPMGSDAEKRWVAENAVSTY